MKKLPDWAILGSTSWLVGITAFLHNCQYSQIAKQTHLVKQSSKVVFDLTIDVRTDGEKS